MRIGIDARYLSHELLGGVHTFVAELIPALIKAAPDSHFFLYADQKAPFELTDLPSNVSVRILPYQNQLTGMYNDLVRMRQMMAADHLDVAHFPANYGFAPAGTRTVITLHDHINILPLRGILKGHPKNPSVIGMMSYLHFCSSRTVRRADRIVTVSEFARQRILMVLNAAPHKVVACPHGQPASTRITVDTDILNAVRAKFDLSRPFVIADGLKNPGTLVAAWQQLPAEVRDQHQIVFFSRNPAPPEAVQRAVEAGYARLIVRPSNQELKALYTLARALAFPSWVEGFGFPVLEAMACGTPVVASNRGSIPEVVGDAGLLCDVEDVNTFARHLAAVLTDSAEHERLRQLGYRRAALFSWDRTARAYLDIYAQARGETVSPPISTNASPRRQTD